MRRREVLGYAGAGAVTAAATFITARLDVFSIATKEVREVTDLGKKVLLVRGILVIPADIPLKTAPNNDAPILSANHPELEYKTSIIILPPEKYQGKPEDESWLKIQYPNERQYGFIRLNDVRFPQGKNSPVEGRLTENGRLYTKEGSLLDFRPIVK